MSRVIFLDAGPLGIVTKRRGVPDAEACRAWVVHEMSQAAPLLAVGGNATNKTPSRSDTTYGQVEAKRAMSA
jgi:hypothetical protein